MVVLWIIFAVTLSAVVFLLLFAAAVEKVAFGKRCEGNPYLSYFTAADFNALQADPVEFKGNRGQILRGNLYSEAGTSEYKALLIFCHGMGGGHLSYTTEIDFFAKHGYLVLGYDNTGTMASQGKSLVGMPQAVRDLQCALQFARADARTKDLPVLLAGHSWGAYTVCRKAAAQGVRGTLAFSAPDDIPALLCEQAQAQIGKSITFLKPFLRMYERLRFGTDAAKPTSEILAESTAPVLLVHGEKDPVVPLKNAVATQEILKGKENIRVILCPEKQHNVYATVEAEHYIAEAFEKLGVLAKKKDENDACAAYAKTLDFHKMCEEDMDVMQAGLQFLDGCLQ